MSGWYDYASRVPSTIHVQMNDIRILLFPQQDQDAFLATANAYDGYWAEKKLLNFLLAITQE